MNTIPPTHTPAPTTLPERIDIRFYELGLWWHECELPRPAGQTQEECLGVTKIHLTGLDKSIYGETFTPPGGIMPAHRLTIGNDVYESVHQPTPDGGFSDAKGVYTFHLFKNSQLLLTMTSKFPLHVGLLNLNGKYAWEFADAFQPTVIYEGVDLRREGEYQGVYRPYVIGETMIFVAKKDGKMFIVADGEQIGPAYDEIYCGYCCETIRIERYPGQYWFRANKDGREFVVVITKLE